MNYINEVIKSTHIDAVKLLIMSISFLTISLLIALRLFIRPLEYILLSMKRLAAGDTSIKIKYSERNDEIGHFARVLSVFLVNIQLLQALVRNNEKSNNTKENT